MMIDEKEQRIIIITKITPRPFSSIAAVATGGVALLGAGAFACASKFSPRWIWMIMTMIRLKMIMVFEGMGVTMRIMLISNKGHIFQ